ncbi:hypothetical protein PCANC_19766 [Puccinia coronata f. sp. avenae]|uniref:Uncharacterized protein n=1 Tax=Puccinia coronata f. sp. avenae TaxID=200324 RepID=A0A2N5UB56_9BASI|nr:hypothetical protein PCANC_19766 [Puccinia coronata f. sp. avenae]
MKHTPPTTKNTPMGTQGNGPTGSTGTGSTGATSSTLATSGTSSTTSTQSPSSSLGFDNTTPQQHQQHFFSSAHQNPPPPPPIFDYAIDPCNRNSINKEAAVRLASDDDKLQADGSNFCSWLNEITEFAIMSLDNPVFCDHPQPLDAKEISCDKSTPAAGVANTIRNKLLDLCETGVELNEDTLCGIVLQNGVAQGTNLRQE